MRIPRVRDVPAPPAPIRVVGDVHLCEEQPAVVERFLAWLASCRGGGGSLVLLGDLFEAWAGRPQQRDALPSRVREVLAAVARGGTRLYFLRGNRDFMFDGMSGVEMTLWRHDPVRFEAAGRTVLMTHGDLLCTADRGYQNMRRFLYGPIGMTGRIVLPYAIKRRLGDGLRGLSRKEVGKKAVSAMGLDYGQALRWMEHHGAEVLLAGHVHTGVHHRHAGPPAREILVLKDWERGGSEIHFDGRTWTLRAIS